MNMNILNEARKSFNDFLASEISRENSVSSEVIDKVGFVEVAKMYSSESSRVQYCKLATQMLRACIEHYAREPDPVDNISNMEMLKNWENVIGELHKL